jgi:uncharacterized protein YciI
MPQYLVVAWDGNDAGAKDRRLAARTAHFANVGPMAEAGQIMLGGAILDDGGEMIGSACVVDFSTRAELDAWLASDPYVVGKVWQRLDVYPMRVAVQAPRRA